MDERLKLLLLLPNDDKNVMFEIRADRRRRGRHLGVRPLKLYTKYAQTQNWRARVVSQTDSEAGGCRDVWWRSERSVYSKLKFEAACTVCNACRRQTQDACTRRRRRWRLCPGWTRWPWRLRRRTSRYTLPDQAEQPRRQQVRQPSTWRTAGVALVTQTSQLKNKGSDADAARSCTRWRSRSSNKLASTQMQVHHALVRRSPHFLQGLALHGRGWEDFHWTGCSAETSTTSCSSASPSTSRSACPSSVPSRRERAVCSLRRSNPIADVRGMCKQ